MIATGLLDGAGRNVATVGGVEFYLGQARLVNAPAVIVRDAVESCGTWVWRRGSKAYHGTRDLVPPECADSARPLRDFLLVGELGEVVEQLRANVKASPPPPEPSEPDTVTVSEAPTVHIEVDADAEPKPKQKKKAAKKKATKKRKA